jgi:DnaJ-class molecular chaperone
MHARNYYVLLGVSRNETPAGIRAAFREMAKRLHPDRAGQQGTAAFQELAEAYEVLSDPGRRLQYDRDLSAAEERPAAVRRTVPVEPLAPEAPSFFGRPETVRPSFHEVYDRYARNFTGRHVPKAERAEALTLELILTPEEAALGCRVPIGVPAIEVCGRCGGAGHDGLFPCLGCGGSGLVEGRRTLWVSLPPLIRSGSIVEVPLDGFGVHNFYLRLHIRVSAAA